MNISPARSSLPFPSSQYPRSIHLFIYQSFFSHRLLKRFNIPLQDHTIIKNITSKIISVPFICKFPTLLARFNLAPSADHKSSQPDLPRSILAGARSWPIMAELHFPLDRHRAVCDEMHRVSE